MTGPAVDPASQAPQSPPTAQLSRQQRGVRGALLRYRFMAFFTGVMLLILTFVAIPLQVWGHNDVLVHIFGFIHGWGFIVYLVTVADLGLRLRWHLVRIVLVGPGRHGAVLLVHRRAPDHEADPGRAGRQCRPGG